MTHDEQLTRRVDTGCLILADLSGYTDYLRTTELEHAEDVLADLTRTVTERLGATLTVSKLEGDAIFAYGLDGSVDATMLLDSLDDAYFAFRRRVRDIAHTTTCDCNACRLIPSINLKFVAHHGDFVRRRMAGGEELTGNDVILVHRLLKNEIVEEQKIDAYAFLTDPLLSAMGLDPETLKMVRHSEELGELGTVSGYVEDLSARWVYHEERQRDFVSSGETEFEIVEYVEAPPPVVWEFMTSPSKRVLWEAGVTAIDEHNNGGRRGEGTWNHCMHGEKATLQEITDWRPFRYFTVRGRLPIIGWWKWTIEFRSEEGGTRYHIRSERLHGLRRRLGWALLKWPFLRKGKGNADRLRQVIADELRERSEPTLVAESG